MHSIVLILPSKIIQKIKITLSISQYDVHDEKTSLHVNISFIRSRGMFLINCNTNFCGFRENEKKLIQMSSVDLSKLNPERKISPTFCCLETFYFGEEERKGMNLDLCFLNMRCVFGCFLSLGYTHRQSGRMAVLLHHN